MPTTRTRRGRRKSALPAHIQALFDVGCGHSTIGDDEFKRLWDEHGDQHLRTRPGDWALSCWGQPNKENDA